MKPPRVLVVTDHIQIGRAIEHHLKTIWPGVRCRVHSPQDSGRLHPAFNAAGYHLAFVDEHADEGNGVAWLANLSRRDRFPPLIYLRSDDNPRATLKAKAHDPVGILSRDDIDLERLTQIARVAAGKRYVRMQRLRNGPRYAGLCRFGSVTIPGYRCVSELAEAAGSTAKVYLAESEAAGEMVVLKVLPIDGEADSTSATFARFRQEYELISRIHHPHVVRILDMGLADDHAFIAMEYFPNGDLRARMAHPIPPKQALIWLGQMAAALEAVHAHGVLHRDLKPGNILMRSNGSVALIDFGIAKFSHANTEITAVGAIFGTPYYMSPEQGHGKDVDRRSDLYSLGVLFYEMLMRRKPFTAPSPMGVIYLHRNAPVPTLNANLAALQPLLDRLLAKDPNDRFDSAADLSRAIDRLRFLESYA